MVTTAASVAANLPWKQIIASLPAVVATAQRLWQGWRTSPPPKPVDPGASLETQIVDLGRRVEGLERNEKSQAEVISQIAEQLQGIAMGLKEESARVRRLTLAMSGLAVGVLVLGAVALLSALNS